MKTYAEQVSQLLATEKNLRLQLTADGENSSNFRLTLVRHHIPTALIELHCKSSLITCLDTCNKLPQDIYTSQRFIILWISDKLKLLQDALVKSNEVFETFKQEIEKRERMKKQLEKTKNQKEKLESLCRSLQAERKQNPIGQSNAAD